MKFTDYITWLILCVGVCIGCSDKEEVVPSDLKDNYFAVPDDATDPESLLRKSFKQETGIHLLFNDTLRCELRGTDRYGEKSYLVETVNYSYYLTSVIKPCYLFTYIHDIEEQKVAAEFIKERVLSAFSSKIYPYSLLLAKKIDCWQLNNEQDAYEMTEEDLVYISGWIGMAISCRNILEMTESEKAVYAEEVLREVVADNISKVDEKEFDRFFSYAETYYEKWSIFAPLSDIKTVGFLGSNPLMGTVRVWYTKAEDQASYVNALLSMTEDEFMAENGDYPACVTKWKEMKRILTDLGLKFE